ncbi:MAG TPA: cytochrome c oxidase assembly protein [Longimicrobiales bacterium]|nr:cytochrome c oxidase assembly protein [Longimicrobiales bacterium]
MSRRAALASGAAALAAAWLVPFDRLLPGPFSAYMAMHVAVVAVAAPLLALGTARSALGAALPTALLAPLPAAALELVVVWGWHAPALHQAARGSAGWLVLEQASFLGAGLLLWLAALGAGGVAGAEAAGRGTRVDTRRGAGVVALLVTSMHMTLLGALLALPPRALYAHVPASSASVASAASVLADQHLGGAIMLAVGGASYLTGGLALTRGLLAGGRRRTAPRAAGERP